MTGTIAILGFNATPTRQNNPLRAWFSAFKGGLAWLTALSYGVLLVLAAMSVKAGVDPFSHALSPTGGPPPTDNLFTARALVSVGAFCGVVFPIVDGWRDRFPAEDVTERAVDPAALLRADRRNCVRKVIWLTVTLEVVIAVIGGPVMLNVHVLARLLVGGLVLAAFINCWLFVYTTAWGRWLLGRLLLPLCRRLPWRIMGFLDDARRRGVLRQIGGVYEFRHARLRDSLAELDPTKRPPDPPAPSAGPAEPMTRWTMGFR